jgi:cellulose synthase/poly-beta-1,6-N-acetylglucosamine synthase-like glycosyltransferase
VQGVEFSCTVPFLAVFLADRERAGNSGMAVVNGKWVQRARWKDGPIFTSVLPIGRLYKPSISPTSSKRLQVMKSTVLPGRQLLSTFEFFYYSYYRFELYPILAASSKSNILQIYFTVYIQE